ncbi:MAG: hypothetical protein ACREH5_04660 [Candidatus Omnitrophota bacterium]
MKKIGLLVLLAALAGVGIAHGGQIPSLSWQELSDRDISPEGKRALSLDQGRWKHAETEHFVYHYWDEKEAETVYLHAEVYYQWVKKYFGLAQDNWKKKAHVFVFTDKSVWEKFREDSWAIQEAHAFTTGWELFIYRDPYWLSPKKTLAHELTHVIVFRFLEGPIPLFLNEGFAEFISYKAIAPHVDGDLYRLRTVEPIPADQFIPVEKLMEMSSYPEGEVEIFYRESELLARFLITKYKGKDYYVLLKEVSKGRPFRDVLPEIYNLSFRSFAEEFKQFAVSPA